MRIPYDKSSGWPLTWIALKGDRINSLLSPNFSCWEYLLLVNTPMVSCWSLREKKMLDEDWPQLDLTELFLQTHPKSKTKTKKFLKYMKWENSFSLFTLCKLYQYHNIKGHTFGVEVMVELNTSLFGNSNVTTAISLFLAYVAIQGLFK